MNSIFRFFKGEIMDYYIHKNDQNIGPISESEVVNGLRSGRFSPKDLGCRVGEDKWQDLDFFFPNTEPSLMDQQNSPRTNTYNAPHQTAPLPNYVNNPQPSFQSPVQPYVQPMPVQHVVHHYQEAPEGALPQIALIAGIVLASLTVIGLVPCLGWLNWFVLILGGTMKIVCLIALFTGNNSKGRNKALIGLLLVLFALIVGGTRLVLGGGCI